MSRFGKTIVCMLLAMCVMAFADSKDLSEYPLSVAILQINWDSDRPGGAVGSGYGNVKDGDSFRGFYFVCTCGEWFAVSQDSDAYHGKWKKYGSRLEIISSQIGNTDKKKRCELGVTIKDQVYLLKDGRLVTATLEQWKQMENMRTKAPVVPADSSAPPPQPQNSPASGPGSVK